MVLIDSILAREILDSRGQPTVETKVVLTDGTVGLASVPAGASRGAAEALELRDKDFARFFGLGVLRAVKNVNEVLAPRLRKMNPLEQNKIDKVLLELDSTSNKGHLGANSILSVSLANAVASARLVKKPLYQYLNELFRKIEALNRFEEKVVLPEEKLKIGLPIPVFNLINGGKHADNPLAFQEYSVVPLGVEKTTEQVRAAVEIDRTLKEELIAQKYPVAVGDEGGFAPHLPSDTAALEFLQTAIAKTGYQPGKTIALALDFAASQFYKNGKYVLPLEHFEGNGEVLSKFYQENILSRYPILIMEDPFAEEDWSTWKVFKAQIKEEGRLMADDLTVTNRGRVLKAIEEEAINSIVIKPNQSGTLTETLQVVKIAKEMGLSICAAHRSGETNDTFIVDLAVGIGAEFLKAGAPVRGERVAKYNRLMEIAEEIE